MTDAVKLILIAIVAVPIFYLLYINGYMFLQRKRALSFKGLSKAGLYGADTTKCTGWTKKIIVVKEQAVFTLKTNLSEGDITVKLSGKNGTTEMGSRPVTLPRGRYTVHTIFTRASGDYRLEWQ